MLHPAVTVHLLPCAPVRPTPFPWTRNPAVKPAPIPFLSAQADACLAALMLASQRLPSRHPTPVPPPPPPPPPVQVDASLTVTGVGITQQAFAEGTTLREGL